MESNRSPKPSGAASGKTWSRRIYYTGLALFFATRLLGIWGGYFTGENARNGGDALTYLWHAQASLHGYPTDSTAIQSVKQQLADHHLNFETDGTYPMFIHTRLQGTATPLFDVVLGSLHALVHDDGLAYALVETLTTILLSLGAGCFLKRLVGWRAAGLGLLLMGVMTMPRQGIDTLIASLAATGLCLWIAGALLKAGRPRWGWIAPGMICLLLVHSIGLVFAVFLCALAALISWRRGENLLRGRAALFITIAVGAVALRTVLYASVPGMSLPKEYHGVVHDLSQLGGNAERAFRFIYDVLRKNLAVLLLLVVGVWQSRSRFFPRHVCWTFLAWGLVSICTLAHYLPGFKADVFGRVLVVAAFVICGLAARMFFRRSTPQWVKTLACVFFAVHVTHWFVVQLGEQMHFNWYAFDLNKTEQVLKQQKPEEKLLFVEGEQTLQTLMLAGAGSHEILWMPAYAKDVQPWKVATETPQWTGVVGPPRELNCLAMIRPMGLSKRREGVSFIHCTGLQIEALDRRELPPLVLKFLNTKGLDQVLFVPYDKTGARMPAEVLQTKHNDSGEIWLVQGAGVHRLDAMLPEKNNWLVGLHAGTDNTILNWPWNSGLLMRYSARNVRANPMYTVDFDLRHAMQIQATGNLPPPPFDVVPVDDSSGLIFFRRQTP
ncbi:hypothetical protein [Prosthecobacter sp.]|uniref:hypothetical protein n=1 Tax=Prosthecobacter sp. TaxID=1965333 RepID=UPI003782E4C0